MPKDKVLVVHASEYGSTKEIAEVVAEEFYQKGFKVDILKASEVVEIKQYKIVIVGAPIQYDQWMQQAKNFIHKYSHELSQKITAYYFTCLTLVKNREKDIKQGMKYSKQVFLTSQEVKPLSVGAFAGVLDYSKMNFFRKMVGKIIFTVLKIKAKDYRNWNDIYSWISRTISEVEKNLLQSHYEN